MKLGLGTVQFGTAYGVSNTHGQTSRQETSDILSLAASHGIATLDTAPAYGNSETVLGQCMAENHDFEIVTKTPAGIAANDQPLKDADIDALDRQLDASLNTLKRASVYGWLVHQPQQLLKPGSDQVFSLMQSKKAAGLVQKIGASVYTAEELDIILDRYPIDLVQLPINVLDQRLIKKGCLDRLKANGIEIHVRSAFLQGLLLMPLNNLPDYFAPMLPTLTRWHEVATSHGPEGCLKLALAYVHNQPQVDRVIVGINTAEQLAGMLRLDLSGVPDVDWSLLALDDPDFVDPRCWPSNRP